MSAPLLALLRAPSLWVLLGLAYAGAGAGLAWQLGRLGHGLGTSSMALLCWPLLLGLARRPPPTAGAARFDPPGGQPHGPNGARIDACVASLARSVTDSEREDAALAAPLIDAQQLTKLASSLHRADRRIARVNRLLHETELEAEATGEDLQAPARAPLRSALAELRGARDAAQDELEAVLAGLLSLRVQLGMFALAGEVEPVRERLAEFEARVSALAELSSIELARVNP